LNLRDNKSLNKSTTSNDIRIVIKKIPPKKSPGPDGFTSEYYQIFKENLIPILLKLFHKIQKEGIVLNSFYKVSITLTSKERKMLLKEEKLYSSFPDEHRMQQSSIKYLIKKSNNTLKKSNTMIK
jgi:hypothetical protein